MAKSKRPIASSQNSKNETIREAIDLLRDQGRDITTAAILWLMRSKGRADIWITDIYASPTWKEAVAREKENANSPIPENQEIKMPKGKAKQVSKMEAMRQVIQKLGQDAENTALHAALKSDFGVTMTTGMFSNYKSAVMKEIRAGKRGPKPGAKPAAIPATNGKKADAGGITVEEISAVKKLVDQLGAEKVEKLARVLAK